MKTLIDQLSQYADYHRDPRNIATHFVGIPMIVVAVAILAARPMLGIAGLTVSPAAILALACTLYYLRLDLGYGLLMGVLLGAAVACAHSVAAWSTVTWLGTGLGLFLVGWVIQFIGHYWEGRKPAFVDDLVGLVIGPLFVVAELGFLLGWRRDVQAAIEARSGPVRSRAARVLPSSHA